MKNKALFLDRDGVICGALPRGEYLVSWDEFRLVDGILEFLESARKKGYKLLVIANQAQVAKGLMQIETLREIHKKMRGLLRGLLDEVYFCPHKEGDGCECRKPKPGLAHRAIEEFDIDPTQSFFIGDSDKDIAVGRVIGARTVFIRNEYNAEELKKCNPDFVCSTLAETEKLI